MKKNIQNSLASRLQELSLKFKRNQREYLTTLRGSELGGDSDDPFALDISQVQTTLSHALVDDVSFSHNMAMQREEELRNLLKSIEELNSIFKDISILVIEQGTILDRIDYNIERADHNLNQAAENLDIVRSRSCFELFLFLTIPSQTHMKAKSSRTKQCMLFLVICVLGLVLVVVAKIILEI